MKLKANHRSDNDGLAEQTSSGVETKEHIVPLVRRWLRAGISSSNLRSSVRIQDITELTGGLKSPVVGAVTVSLQVIVKQGSDELITHEQLMNEINRRAKSSSSRELQMAVFPEVLAMVRRNDDDRVGILRQQGVDQDPHMLVGKPRVGVIQGFQGLSAYRRQIGEAPFGRVAARIFFVIYDD